MVHLELLAPAKNTEIGIAAIDCGADAVYIAGPAFGARQAAGNSIEDIKRLCEYAHLFGVRIFITLNTIIYDDELEEAYKILEAVRDAGADAIIVQDPAILKLAEGGNGRSSISLPMHASTQCAIRTPETAIYYESLGFSRLVLERELSVAQVLAIRNAVSCEIEFFVHGALCVCYSGQCYLSEMLTGRSANRGECAQPCRSRYDLTDSDGNVILRNKAVLSLKDYNLKTRLKDLADSGVCSFKIEGRLKNISYVKNVVREYSIALDELCRREPDRYSRASFGKVTKGFAPDPLKTFNRGYTELYIDGKRGKWAAMDTPKSMGEALCTISSIKKAGKGYVELTVKPLYDNLRLANGDGFSFATEKGIAGFRGDICSGNSIKCKAVPDLKVGFTLYRNYSASFEKELENNICTRLIGVDVNISISSGNDGEYILKSQAVTEDGRMVSLERTFVADTAKNPDRMISTVESQINKASGIFNFRIISLETATECNNIPYMSSSFLNSIRRGLAEEIERQPCRCIAMAGGKKNSGIGAEKHVNYKANIANRIAEADYMARGAQTTERAYEITHRQYAELMRTKYCVRYELGMCPKYHRAKDTSPLFLLNNGKKLTLNFDCKVCEMTVTERPLK